MKKFTLLLFVVCVGIMFINAKSKEDQNLIPEYQIEGTGTENGSTTLVVVTIVSKNNDFREHDFGRCAVHGILFRGFTNAYNSLSTSNHPALMGSPMAEMQNADFFNNFFQSTYAGYVRVQSDSRKVVKVGKEYKQKVIVAVSERQLRKDLEDIGLIKSLKSGW